MLLWLAVLAMVGVSTCDVTFYNPMSSSSYARVQYANTNNSVIRRLGAHRDPTIQYVNFDDLYNKHNAKSTYGEKVRAPAHSAPAHSAPAHSAPAHSAPAHSAPAHSAPTYDSSWDQEEITDRSTTKTLSWEEAPDLTNGWTIEKQEVTTPSPGPKKQTALDYVYAYSNAYSQHDNFPKGKVRGPSTTTTAKTTNVNSYADDSAEYAHYLNTGDLDLASSTASAPPPMVMEASWTEERIPTHHFPSNKPLKPTPDTPRKQPEVKIRKMTTTTTTAAPSTTTTTTQATTTTSTGPNVKRNRNGVQSDWRPFSATAAPSTEGTLFYSDTQNNKQSFSEKQQTQPFPAENIPVFMLQNEEKAESTQVLFPSPTENEISKTEAMPKPTFPSLQSSASISVSGGAPQSHNQDRPNVQNNNNFQRFQQNNNNNNQFQRPQGGPQQRPNRPQQQFQGPPPQHQGQNWPSEHNFGPNEHNLRPNEQNFRPNEANFRPNEPHMRPNEPNNFRPGPFNGPMPQQQQNLRPPQEQQPPQRLPSGPVGLPPQLQMNQGRPEEDHMTIRLPLPKPGMGLGSSPQNPLPGPPIFLNPQDENDRIDGPSNGGGGPAGGQFDNFNHIPGANPQFRPPPNHPGQRFPPPNFPMRPQGPPPPHFRPPTFFGPPPSTTTATSIIKSFFSKIFPFGARSLDTDDVSEDDALVVERYNHTEPTTPPPEVTTGA